MAKKSEKSERLYVGKTLNHTVEYGKYKDKHLTWVGKNDLEFFKEIKTLYYPKYNILKKLYYDKLEKRFVNNNGFKSKEQFHQLIHRVVDLMREGYTTEKIHKEFTEKYKYTTNTIANLINDAHGLVRKEFDLEKNFLLDIHLIRYEEIFVDCMNPDIDNVPAGFRRAVLCEHYLNAMETLFQKEKLLGIHTKKFKLKANSLLPQYKANTEFDITKLNSVEQLEVRDLLNKAKPVEQLNRSIVPNDNPLDIDTSYKIEEVIIDAPIQKAKVTDEIGDREAEENKGKGKTLFEVEQAMKKTLEDKVRAIYEKKKKK